MEQIKHEYSEDWCWQEFSHDLGTEYKQCIEEGLDVAQYKPLFDMISNMPEGEKRKTAADFLFELICDAPAAKDYVYIEPSDYPGICKCRTGGKACELPDEKTLREKVSGAWYGRIIGCLLGKPIEGIKREELIPLLKETGNYPMHRYVLNSDITDEIAEKYKFQLRGKCYTDTITEAPIDDDTNYTVLYQRIIENYGRDFTPDQVAKAWLAWQPKDAYFTAEQIAYCNFVNGYRPPYSAMYKNHYREWIGAQIRGDYFGYINPGNPEKAAEMAWKDASISHTKNGIYGEMFVAAMLAAAASSSSMPEVIRAGLSQIPEKSRLHERVLGILNDFENGTSEEATFKKIVTDFNDYANWCDTISNASIVTASLLYGKGDFGKSICLAVQTGFDTDCNGATVGSIFGEMFGRDSIDDSWASPLNDRLETSLIGAFTVDISTLVDKTLKHINESN